MNGAAAGPWANRAAGRILRAKELVVNPLQRRQVWYSGRVQGVGFRATTRWVAERFEVTGYVRNLPDGRVLVVAEGSADELDRFLAAVSESLDRYIRSSEVEVSPATGELAGFEIRH